MDRCNVKIEVWTGLHSQCILDVHEDDDVHGFRAEFTQTGPEEAVHQPSGYGKTGKAVIIWRSK